MVKILLAVKVLRFVNVSVCTPLPTMRKVELSDKAIEAKVLLNPPELNSPPLKISPLLEGILLLVPNCKVPPLTVVVPIYVFTLLRINTPAPLLVKFIKVENQYLVTILRPRLTFVLG